MAHMRLSRVGRKQLIEAVMVSSSHDIHTVNSIAKIAGMKPSTYLRSLIHEMVNEETLAVKEVFDDSGNIAKRFYSLDYRIPDSTEYFQYIFQF